MMIIWDEASEMPPEVWSRPMVVSPTLYRMLEERGADMRFYKMNEPLPVRTE